MNILEALDHPDLFGGSIRNAETWGAWRVFLAALFGLGMTAVEMELFTACTGRTIAPITPFSAATLICGRRAGKSFTMALVAVYLACFRNYAQYLGPGERATIMVIAADRRQARVIMRYVRGLLAIPILAKMLETERAESFDLNNRVTIEVATGSIRSVRGYTIAACLCDELAFWGSEDSASPDKDVIDSIKPAMATIPGAILLCASSPYARRGVLWSDFKRYFGKNDAPVLVWKAATRTMNPAVPQQFIDEAYEADPASAAAEYGAEFRTDIESFLSREVIDAAVVQGRHELPYMLGVRYIAFVDPSGGSADSMTLAIAHPEGDIGAERGILDVVREFKPPFSPDSVVEECAALLKSYGIDTVHGDRYAGEWPRERFRVNGIEYLPSEKPKSDIYRDLLPLLNSGRVDLLDNPRIGTQLAGLERRTARGGRDSIDHAPGQHDDLANAVAGAIVLAAGKARRLNMMDVL